MKKFIVPILASVLLLTSCSDALYKHNYDWIKVKSGPYQVILHDTATNDQVVVISNDEAIPPVSETSLQSINDEIILSADTVETYYTGHAAFTEKAGVVAKEIASTQKRTAMKNVHADRLRVGKRQYSDWQLDSETIGLLAGLLLVVLLLSGTTKLLNILLFIYYAVMLIAGLIGCALIIYGLLWLLFGDVPTGLFWWTSK